MSERDARIAELRLELNRLDPANGFSVREIARLAGISPTTAQRFRKGMQLDIPTVQALIKAKLIAECPCCGGGIKEGAPTEPVPSLAKLFDDMAAKQRSINDQFEEFMSDVEDGKP